MASSPPPCPPVSMELSTPPTDRPLPPHSNATVAVRDRRVQRERERQSRVNRIQRQEKMLADVASLERVAMVLRVMQDKDTIWDEFLDEDTKWTRAFHRRFAAVRNEVKQLINEKAQLQRLLTEHELARRAVARMVEAREVADEWGANWEHWKMLTRIFFRPLTTSECMALVNTTLLEIADYLLRQEKESSGLVFMGWRENRRVVPNDESSTQFSLEKTFRACNLNLHIETVWRMYSDVDFYSKIILGGRGRVSLDVVQKLSPTAWVVRLAETYDGTHTVHGLFLLSRMKIDNGMVMFARCFDVADVRRTANGPNDRWTFSYTWIRLEVLEPSQDWSSIDYRMSAGGFMDVDHASILWLCELVAICVRCESFFTGHKMLKVARS